MGGRESAPTGFREHFNKLLFCCRFEETPDQTFSGFNPLTPGAPCTHYPHHHQPPPFLAQTTTAVNTVSLFTRSPIKGIKNDWTRWMFSNPLTKLLRSEEVPECVQRQLPHNESLQRISSE